MKLALYWSYVTRSLLRGGQRTLLAVFCVAVGVMAIVALQLVGLSVNQALIGNVVAGNGGDMRLNADLTPLRAKDLNVFATLQQQGQITAYATAYDTGGSITLPTGEQENFSFIAVSSNFPLVGQPHFIAPTETTSLQDVVKGNDAAMSTHVFQDLHAHLGSVYRVKTIDGRYVPIIVAAVFQENGAYRGSQVYIAQATLDATPGPGGARLPAQYNTVYMSVPSANLNAVKTQLSQTFEGAQVITAQDLLQQRESQVQQIQLFLRIVGLLALFIGGIGIINTMQVLLRRRQVEIAMLKTTGYRQIDLYALFGLEAALLGILGGVVGTLAGIGASYLVRLVVGQAFQLDLPIVLDTLTISSGLLIGLATALIFGLLSIVQSSQIRPLAVLRDSPEGTGMQSRLTSLLLLILLSLLFAALAASILQDVVTAIITVYGGAIAIFALAFGLSLLVLAISKLPVYERPRPRMLLWVFGSLGLVMLAVLAFAGLTLLGNLLNTLATRHGIHTLGIYALAVCGGLGIVLLACALIFALATLVDSIVMFLPLAWKTPVMLAYRNIGRQRIRTTTTLSALFVGVFAIGIVLVLGQGIKDTVNSTLSALFTRNVFVVAPPTQRSLVEQQLAHAHGIDAQQTIVNNVVPQIYPLFLAGQDINTALKSINDKSALSKRTVLGNVSDIEGFALAQGGVNIPAITIVDGRDLRISDAGTTNVLLNAKLEQAPIKLRVGNTLIVQSADGAVTKSLTVVGFYDSSDPTKDFNFASILADQQITAQLGGTQTLDVFSLKVDPDALPALKQQLSTAVPRALLISVTDIDAIINQVLDNVVIMLTTIASLAMIAGLVIIANAVALAMLERQREIGILKSVGYTSRSVLATMLIENGIVGLLSSLVAMLLVAGSITALSKFVFQIQLGIGPWLVVLLIAVTSLVTTLIALLVARNATRVRPLTVLRYE
jgi:putative ABC transport system permease protein